MLEKIFLNTNLAVMTVEITRRKKQGKEAGERSKGKSKTEMQTHTHDIRVHRNDHAKSGVINM
ncbi:MAG: hypothetical protein ACREBD_07830 [Blastocatellia bacterium]